MESPSKDTIVIVPDTPIDYKQHKKLKRMQDISILSYSVNTQSTVGSSNTIANTNGSTATKVTHDKSPSATKSTTKNIKSNKEITVKSKILSNKNVNNNEDNNKVNNILFNCDLIGKEINKKLMQWTTLYSLNNNNTGENSDTPRESAGDNEDCSDNILNVIKNINNNSRKDCDKKLKDYQLIGISWMLMLHKKSIGGILADEMGLGKTAQVINFLGILKQQSHTGLTVIVVPSSTLDNWLREIEIWCPFLNAVAYVGSQKERRDLQYDIYNDPQLDIMVVPYQIATNSAEDRQFIRKLKAKRLILDEGHMIKNGNSNRSKHLKGFKIPFKLLITGTPIQNNLMELLSLLTFINPELFEDAFYEFSAIFNESTKETITTGLDHNSAKHKISQASRILNPFVLRRTKANVLTDLPKKITKIEYCTPVPAQSILFKQILSSTELSNSSSKIGGALQSKLSNILMELRKASDHQLLHRKLFTNDLIPAIAQSLKKELEYLDTKLDHIVQDLQVMSDFEIHSLCTQFTKTQKYILDSNEFMNSGKINWLKANLPKFKANGDKILIFSQFVIMLDILESVLPELDIDYIRLDGSTPSAERIELIDDFNDNPDITVFLLSTKACGLGINLTSANTVILYDIDFNPHNDAQAEDRAHRVGQLRPVTVYKLIMENSVEQHMLTTANMKLLLDKKVRDTETNTLDNEDDELGVIELLRNDILESQAQ